MNTKLLKFIYSFHLLIIIQIVIYLLIIPTNCYGHLIQHTSYNNNNTYYNNNNTDDNHNNTTKNNNSNNTIAAPIIIKIIPENNTTTIDTGRIVKNLHDSTKSEIYDYYFSTSPFSESTEVGRTFGAIKKLQMSLLPVMFKLGVISTIIVLILFLTIKAVGIGLLLLMINIGFIIAKVVAFKSAHMSPPPDYHQHHESYQHGGWQSAPPIWESSPPSSVGANNKEIHLHIHNDGDSKHNNKHEPYGSYSSNTGQIYLGGPSARSSSSSSGIYDGSTGGWRTSQTNNFRKRPFIYTIDYDDDKDDDDDDNNDDDDDGGGEYQTSIPNSKIYNYIYRYN